MLKNLIIIALMISGITVKAQPINYHLKGKVGHYSAPAKAYLLYSNGKERHVDSTFISNGLFFFTGKADRPKTATLFISTKGLGFMSYDAGYLNLYLENGKVSIISRDSLQHAIVAGGPLNRDYDELQKGLRGIDVKLDQVNNIFAAAPPAKQQSTKFRDSIVKESLWVMDERKVVGLAFLKSHPSSLVSLTALAEYAGIYPDPKLIEPAFRLLSANVRSSKEGLGYAAEITRMKKTAIGAAAPDFTLKDTLGKAISLHDFRGKYVLIDFWASWCAPCRAENPNLIQAYQLYREKNFTILGVSSDVAKAKAQWLQAIHDDHLPWAQVADLDKGSKNEAMEAYGISAIPQNLLISPEGIILDKNLRGEALAVKLQQLFKSK